MASTIQYADKVTWLTTPVSKNWIYAKDKYTNAPWENVNSPAQLAINMTAHVGEDGPVVVTVGIMKSTTGPLFTPMYMGSTRIFTCADLPDNPLSLLNIAQPAHDLLHQLNIIGCWQVFVNALRMQEDAAKYATEV